AGGETEKRNAGSGNHGSRPFGFQSKSLRPGPVCGSRTAGSQPLLQKPGRTGAHHCRRKRRRSAVGKALPTGRRIADSQLAEYGKPHSGTCKSKRRTNSRDIMFLIITLAILLKFMGSVNPFALAIVA